MLVKSQVKYIQSLSQKKLRDEEGVFVAEGPKIINELLQAGNPALRQVFGTAEWLATHPELPAGIALEVTPEELGKLSFLQTPNQVLGIFRKPVFSPSDHWQSSVSLMLDTLQDPGNLGTILRCADWFGIKRVICSKDSADVFNPKVVQSTMGSIARVEVIYEDLPAFIRQHPQVPVYATTLNGRSLQELGPVTAGIILIGNESRGIHEELLALASHRITIPRKGQAESLNAAVATGIILSHIVS